MNQSTIENLTYEMWKLCVGKDVSPVVGASLNICFTALASVDSPEIRAHFANSLRDMADKLEKQEFENVH